MWTYTHVSILDPVCPGGFVALGQAAVKKGTEPANFWCVNGTYVTTGSTSNWQWKWDTSENRATNKITLCESTAARGTITVQGFRVTNGAGKHFRPHAAPNLLKSSEVLYSDSDVKD